MKDTTMEGLFLPARVKNVYDGDTMTIAVLPPWHQPAFPFVGKLRLSGIDAPEKKPRMDDPLRDLQMQAAARVQQIVTDKVQRIVWIEFFKNEKFGRMMGRVYLDQFKRDCLNDWLITKQLVKPYEGQKKSVWTEAELKSIICWKPLLPLLNPRS
jgi:endonuclease YncB( thermonuclease family)